MAERPKIKTAPGASAKRKAKRERVAKSLFTVMKLVDDDGAPETYEELPDDEREEFEELVGGLIELWDALSS